MKRSPRRHGDSPRIFEYGVSEANVEPNLNPRRERRGQGLFVARTRTAKVGGTIAARNDLRQRDANSGVSFVLRLRRSA